MFGVKTAKKQRNTIKPVVVVAPAPAQSKVITPEAVARRAYHIWVKKGRPQGEAGENWKQAEQELRAEQQAER